jgi:lipopolysaccharide export LptBFGC system permease protein LptF
VKLLAAASGSALVSVIAASPALAGSPVPGPVVGAGLPALAVIAGGYYLIRRRRRQS